ncbi:NUDIX domain-containing protein [Actinoplanes sp. G11-F43]|uniref:NUDIX domain-containing protein n=1 Tax=Actinoplanes sp. G11-F43 TaxID=3424130 RepID=UPI003D349120
MTSVHRPAVRILCFDKDGWILLLNWADPLSHERLWEPPGGGIDPGETPWQAARRELAEETGLDPSLVGERFIDVDRDFVWKGTRFTGPEQFFAAFLPTARPPVVRDNLMPYEQTDLIAQRWVDPSRLTELPDRLDPPTLPSLARELRTWA